MPSEVYEMFYAKKVRMEKDVREITGKNIPLTMPKVFRLIANHQVEIDMDYLAKFAYGVDASKKGKTGEYYKKYINEYLKTIDSRYDANDLYHHLRCGLVHHYSTRYNGTARLLFTHDKPGINLKEDIDQNTSEKRVLLELFQFKDDIYKSSELLFKKIESDPKSKK